MDYGCLAQGYSPGTQAANITGQDQMTTSNVSNETWLNHIRECALAKRAVEEASGRHRAKLKAAKADGVDPKLVAWAVTQVKRRDALDVALELRGMVRVANLLGVSAMMDSIFDGWSPGINSAAQHQQGLFDAEDSGYQAGKQGTSRSDNPEIAGTEAFVEWDKGWIAGQAAIAASMGPGETQASADRDVPEDADGPGDAPSSASGAAKKRGRPLGSKNKKSSNGGQTNAQLAAKVQAERDAVARGPTPASPWGED